VTPGRSVKVDFRLGAILVWLAIVVTAQILVVAVNTSQLWPFNPISVYYEFPSDYRATSIETYVVTAEGERNVVATGAAGFIDLQRTDNALLRATSEEGRTHVAELVMQYVNRHLPPEKRAHGIRMRELTWDLNEGKVVGSRLLAEYVEP